MHEEVAKTSAKTPILLGFVKYREKFIREFPMVFGSLTRMSIWVAVFAGIESIRWLLRGVLCKVMYGHFCRTLVLSYHVGLMMGVLIYLGAVRLCVCG